MSADDVIQDDALTELLKVGDRLRESMGTDLDGTDFKDGEIASLLLLSASTVHLIAELRAARSQRDEARAALAALSAVADDADADYAGALRELESLRLGTREYGEWATNALIESEVRDRVRSALAGVNP